MPSDEILYAIALRRCPLVGDMVFRKLVREVGSARQVWDLSRSGLENIHGIGRRIAGEIGNDEHLRFAEAEIKFCEQQNIRINLRHLGELPTNLDECEDAPAILYQKGTEQTDIETLSIVGTRNITHYGKQFIADLTEELRPFPVATVSGLALGVDTEVHRESIRREIPTVAVLAHGFHTLYPAKNRSLAHKILDSGGTLYTEFNSSQKPDRENFIQRNRVIAGLSASTIVVETAFGGGSISTATFANNYNRDVYALPGRIDEKYSQGCNQLIYQNKAMAISTVNGLLKQLNLSSKKNSEELFPSSEIKVLPSGVQLQIVQQLDRVKPLSLDDISERLDLPIYKILPDLLQLELAGYIRALSGRQYLAL